MTRPRLIDRVIRETSLDAFCKAQQAARDLGLTLAEYVDQRCAELQREAAARMLSQLRFELQK